MRTQEEEKLHNDARDNLYEVAEAFENRDQRRTLRRLGDMIGMGDLDQARETYEGLSGYVRAMGVSNFVRKVIGVETEKSVKRIRHLW